MKPWATEFAKMAILLDMGFQKFKRLQQIFFIVRAIIERISDLALLSLKSENKQKLYLSGLQVIQSRMLSY